MPTQNISKFDGGLNLTNPTTLKDNEFELLTNFFYNDSHRVQTRRGIQTFGKTIPDAAVLIDACDSATNWSVTEDGFSLATGTAIRGTFSLDFDIDVSNDVANSATLVNSSLSADISTAKGYLAFWLFVPAAFNTDLTAVKVRLGSDSSNYYEWTLGTLTQAANNFIVLLFADATSTGTPVDTTIAYFRWQATYTAAYTDKLAILLDSIYCYSANSSKPVTSLFFSQRDDTQVRRLLAVAGTNIFLYNEDTTYWEVINTGITEFETVTGRTDERGRWDFAVYKNVIYMCNGIDTYRSWNDTLITEYAGEPKVRYLEYLDDGDRIAGSGRDANPSSFYYTASAPADASNLDASTLVIGGDQFGKINGMKALGQVFVVGKDRKKYAVDIANTKSLPLDPDTGWYSNRSIQTVGGGILHQTDQGIEEVAARTALSGADAIESKPLTANLQPLVSQISDAQKNASCSEYIKPLKNYYFTFDTGDDNVPETTIVYSALVKAWSQYSYPAIYDYAEWIDNVNASHFLAASASSGNVLEIEANFQDLGGNIDYELKTKAFDLGDPNNWKDYGSISIFGLKSKGNDITVEILVDEVLARTETISDDEITGAATPAVTIGSHPLGTKPLSGGAGSGDIDLFNYFIKIGGDLISFSSGQKVQVRMYSASSPIVWTLDKLQISYEKNSPDLIPTANQK